MTHRRALVTGGAGFIGSHLVEALVQRGWAVTALDDLSTGNLDNIASASRHPLFRFVRGSVLDADLVDAVVSANDVVYHLAAAVGVQLIVDRPLQALITNIKGTENVLVAAERHRAKVLITSSSEIYGKNQNGPFKEDDDRLLGSARKLRWSYSTSKAVDEILAYLYYKDLALPTVVARLFNTVGPRQSGQYGMVLPRFVGQALRGEPVTVYGDGKQSRVFTYVADVVEALVRLMETPAAEGGVFNVASHEEIRIKDLAERVIQKTSSTSTIAYVPYETVYGGAFEDLERRAADTIRVESVTGHRCTTSLDQMLDVMIEFAMAELSRT